MESITQINKLINELYKINNTINIIDIIKNFEDENKELKKQNLVLKKDYEQKCQELDKLQVKYTEDIDNKNLELKEKNDELKNLTKVSYVQQLNKQLTEKNNYIQLLEQQIGKSKNVTEQNKLPKDNTSSTQTSETHVEPPTVFSELQTTKKSLKLQIEKVNIFNPNDFEDINGYELLVYKKNHYLRDMETNELYDIENNKPNQVIGLITEKGKVKLKK
jgi:hypothetical protein